MGNDSSDLGRLAQLAIPAVVFGALAGLLFVRRGNRRLALLAGGVSLGAVAVALIWTLTIPT